MGAESGSESESDMESSSSSGSSSESNSEDDDHPERELHLDQHGRVVAQMAAENYKSRSFSGIVSKKAGQSLHTDCCTASICMQGDPEMTFWLGASDTPRCSLERAALDIFRFHTDVRGCSFDEVNSGLEWRAVAMDTVQSQSATWHWNKDYGLRHGGVNLSPHLSTMTYLSDCGPPTLVIDKTCPTENGTNNSG